MQVPLGKWLGRVPSLFSLFVGDDSSAAAAAAAGVWCDPDINAAATTAAAGNTGA